MKKLVKDLGVIEAEAKRLSDALVAETRSFMNVLKPYLICSDPEKYVTSIYGSVLPITKTINIDLAILKKHYNDEIPKNLEEASTLFSEIIANHYDRFKFKETSIGQKLSSHLSKLGQNSQKDTCSDESTVQSPYKKKSKSSVTCPTDVDNICTGVNEMASPPKVFSDGGEHTCTSDKCTYVPPSRKELFHKKKTDIP